VTELAWPWLLLALPLPWLLRRKRLADAPPASGLRLPFLDLLRGAERRVGRPSSLPWWLILGWLLFCLALARPIRWSDVEPVANNGRDLMLAVDVSGSMAADDMVIGKRRVDRLTAVKAVVGDFLERREGDRVGLILFGQQAYLMTPLTFDRGSVRYQLDTAAIGLAGRETAIGDAIGLAAKRLRERPPAQRVMVLLTDGVNTAGVLGPDKAAELARDIGLRVYTVAMGSDRTAQVGVFGLSLPSAPAEIDEAALQRIAEATGARFFRARDTGELVQIYAELDRLEPVAEPGERLRLQEELYPYPLAAALLLALAGWLAARQSRRSPRPWREQRA
jgi:Ca-activated chloride channel family protein